MTGVTALVVDDDPFILHLTREFLHDLGIFEVQFAADGLEALEKVKERPPTIIVCDIDMGNMDGLELLRALTATDFDGGVILQSGASTDIMDAAHRLAVAHGHRVLGVVAKPITPQNLEAAVNALAAHSTNEVTPDRSHTPWESAEEFANQLRNGHAEIWVQPKVTVHERKVVGAEALLRWRWPDGTLESPTSVVAAAHRFGMGDDLAVTVMSLAVKELASWRADGQFLTLSVNLTSMNLSSLELPEQLEAAARQQGIDPRHIILEIPAQTEQTVPAARLEIISRLRLKGFGVALEATNAGELNTEGATPGLATHVKLSQSLLRDTSTEESLARLKDSGPTSGERLGLTVVAQGVEDADLLSILGDLGCDEVQGYLISRPMPIGDFLTWKAQWDAFWRPSASEAP